MQEETHRAAIAFHKKQHSKSSLQSDLEKIEGIGPARRRDLLKAFHSNKAIRAASLSDLENVLPKKAAEAVYTYYHKEGK